MVVERKVVGEHRLIGRRVLNTNPDVIGLSEREILDRVVEVLICYREDGFRGRLAEQGNDISKPALRSDRPECARTAVRSCRQGSATVIEVGAEITVRRWHCLCEIAMEITSRNVCAVGFIETWNKILERDRLIERRRHVFNLECDPVPDACDLTARLFGTTRFPVAAVALDRRSISEYRVIPGFCRR